MELLEYFADKKYIINLCNNGDEISFTYATEQIKELLTVEGKMLEVYVYHKIKELGRFDDVVSSCEVNIEDTEVKNEYDTIITKGFRSLFVECKAVGELEQKYYNKLAALAQKYGINATAVLIADTQEKPNYDSVEINEAQRKRGGFFEIITIFKPEEIKDIGNTLLKILNKEYVPQK